MDLKQYKEQVCALVEKVHPELVALSHQVHDNPELGLEEHQAMLAQKALLEKYGFHFETPFCGMDTAFKAYRGTPGKGPQIAFLSEYDALNGLGHACGHNLICSASCGAAIALSQALEGQEGAVFIYGTPAEETVGGKIPMAQSGEFDDKDCAMMFHAKADENVCGAGCLACTDIYVEYIGKTAHSSRPMEGINALTSMISLFNSLSAQLHLWPNKSKINGSILEGGTAGNIIPGYAKGVFCMRAERTDQLIAMYSDFERLAKAAAVVTGAELKLSHSPWCPERYMNRPLDEHFFANMEGLGEKMSWPAPDRMGGSSDVGAVSMYTPTIHPYLSLQVPGVAGHTVEFCAASASPRADEVVGLAAKGLAMTGLDVFFTPELRDAMRKEFIEKALPHSY